MLGATCFLLMAACAPAMGPGMPVGAPRVGEEPIVRVGLLVDTTSVELSSTAGFELIDPRSEAVVASFAANAPVVIRAVAMSSLVYESGGTSTVSGAPTLAARPLGEGALRIGGRTYRGTAEVRLRPGGRVTAVNFVAMEQYLLGVVPREIGAIGDTLIEAAKAQAVAARTYAVAYLGRRETLGFDVFATVEDQVYGGMGDEHPTITRAVQSTSGEILTYDDLPIEAYYHSTCAGRTVAIQDAWPSERPRSYLVSIDDTNPVTGQAYDSRSSRFRWTVRWPVDSLRMILSRTLADSLRIAGRQLGDITDVSVLSRTPTGRVRELRIATSSGDQILRGREIDIRRALVTPAGLPLNSTNFDVQVERNAQGSPVAVVATGGGWGHGIGMCQVGAMGRATAGQDYRTILAAYFPTTEITRQY